MSRLVKEVQRIGGTVSTQTADGDRESYATRVGKYIPGEIMALYLALLGILNDGLAKESEVFRLLTYGVAFLIFLVLTPVYFTRMAEPGDALKVQRIVSTVAFVVWAYSLGGIFKELHIHRDWMGGALLIVFTAISGAIVPYRKDSTPH